MLDSERFDVLVQNVRSVQWISCWISWFLHCNALWHSGISFKHFWEVQRTYQLSQLPNFFLLCPLSTIFPQQCCKRSRYFGFASRKENVKLHPWCYFYILLTLRSVYWRLFLHVPIMFVGRHISWLVYDIIFICVFFFRH